MLHPIGLCVVLMAGGPADTPPRLDAGTVEFFEREVRPILATRCQSCHGAEKRKGGLRLDSREGALAGGDSGPSIVLGKPAASRLVEAINYADELRMPPKSKLPDAEVAALTKWVAAGAPWPDSGQTKASNAVAGASAWKERAKHWSLQPLHRVDPPSVRNAAWPLNPIDRFLLADLEKAGLKPAPDADRKTWLRRVTFDLTGLPPRPAEVDAFNADGSADAYEKVVDRLLSSPQYGERWARHWLDLVRYAETSGHEFDYDLPDAWRYRDFVIRAFNADVPYDQFVVEHIAGDLLSNPRRNPGDGTNESILGTGFFFLGEGTHSPVDLRDEEAARVDNQVDVLGKAFLGTTLACARCHDHKFDAITARDYYALTGFLKSSRFQHAFLDPPDRIGAKVRELERLKGELAARGVIAKAAEWNVPDDGPEVFEDFRKGSLDGWLATGDAFGARPSKAGDFVVHANEGTAEAVPAGMAHSGLVSDRLQGVLRSKTFLIERRFVHVLAQGRGSRVNLVIDGFEKIRSPIYGGLTVDVEAPDAPRWVSIDAAMWKGHRAYLEFADGGTVDYTGGNSRYTNGEGFLAVVQVRFSDHPPSAVKFEGRRHGPLNGPEWKAILDRYREVESSIPAPTLGLAITDGSGEDARVNIRGNPRTPGEIVPRRFVEVLGGADRSSAEPGSGRLELARRIADPANPLTGRVLVNRLWKGHFGEGLVRSPDDFGKMGQAPSHPELLDWLASEFVRGGWTIKRMQRLMVLSHAYRMASAATTEADRADPTNRLLHRMNVRRLEAEAVRDSMLFVSGRLDPTLFGPSVHTHLTPFMEGRGRPGVSGPLDGAGRRSIYLDVRRNFLSPLLLAFDFPNPSSCIGRRNVSNVPAQALTLLNDPFILDQARRWAERAIERDTDPTTRLESLYRDAFGRPPSAREREESRAFLETQGGAKAPRAWADLCHVLFNAKEFLFIP
jgi:mono/diheme cytochrome c family protein